MVTLSCSQIDEVLSKWQRDTVMKRYGVDLDQKKNIQTWEKEILKYEKIINQKVEAGIKTAQIYRKIGEAYGNMGMFQPCIENLQRAVDMGYVNDQILFTQALCMGSLARTHNWDEEYRNQAEAGFLKVLNLNPEYHRAKIELALLYFYGFGSNSKHSVNSEKIDSTQNEYRNQAIKLAREYQSFLPDKTDSYLILAAMFNANGKKQDAINQLQSAVDLFKKQFPKNYNDREDYRQTLTNLNMLQKYK